MSDIYYLKIPSCAQQLISLLPRLSQHRQKLFEDMLIKESRLFNIASEVILAYALNLPLPCEYETDQNGKPFISGQRHFNISHSGNFVVCGVSDYEIGVDVEKVERMSARLMHKFLAQDEIKALDCLSEAQLAPYLCEKWVRKEAYLKLTGTGLRISPASLCFEGDMLLSDKSVFSKVIELSDGEKLSVCSFRDKKIRLIEISPDDLGRIQLN